MQKRKVRVPLTVEVTVEEMLDQEYVRKKVSDAIKVVLHEWLQEEVPIVIDLKVVIPAMRDAE